MCSLTPVSFAIWCFTNTTSAMSIANAMSVSSAATNETRDARSVNVTWVESERRNATSVMPVAVHVRCAVCRVGASRQACAWEVGGRNVPTGCTASPRVHEGPTVCQLDLSELYTVVE